MRRRSAAPRTEPIRALLAAVAVAAAAMIAGASLAQYGPVEPIDSSVRMLRDGLGSRNDGIQHAAMVSLRELRDPALRPMLERLLKSDDWTMRVDSLLGLAELSDDGLVDLEALLALPGEDDREEATRAAITLRMLDQARIERLLAADDLAAPQRVLLATELRRLGGQPDQAMLVRLAQSRTPEIAGIATALLVDSAASDAADLVASLKTMLGTLPARSRAAAVAQVAEACLASRAERAAPLVAELIALPEITGDARMRALGSLLVLAPETAYPVFAASVEADRSQTSLVRHALVLLTAGVRAPKGEWTRLRNGDALLETLADSGELLGASSDLEAYEKIIALGHRTSLLAALEGARRLGESSERALGVASLRALVREGKALGPLLEPSVRAIARLAAIAPEELRPSLAGTIESRDVHDALLLALMGAGTPAAAEVAASAQGRSSRLGEALIVVLRARTSPTIRPDELQLLATVAGGGSGADPAVRTQAAWLWARHAAKAPEVIEAVIGGAPAGSTEGSGG
ncbi:MAG: hypothetical protein ACKO0W_01175 [Planctomycetota bacterium]